MGLALVGLLVSGAGAAIQARNQKKAAQAQAKAAKEAAGLQKQSIDAQKQAQQIQQKQNDVAAARSRRQQYRTAVLSRAEAETSAVLGGAQFSSGLAGGQGSISSQTASNLQGINQGQEFSQQISSANQRSADFRGQSVVAAQSAAGVGASSLGGLLVQGGGIISKIGAQGFGFGR